MSIENIITRKRAHEVAPRVAKPALAILVLDLELEEVVFLLGGINPEEDEAAARIKG